jgi:hypothetical protein
LFYTLITRLTVMVKLSPADPDAAENIRQGHRKEAERDVVENRLSHSFRFGRLSAAVTSPRL